VLLERGHDVVASFSDGIPSAGLPWVDRVEVVAMDVLDCAQVGSVVDGIDAVYYLIHGLGGADFAERDRLGAKVMADAARADEVGRIIYLSGIVPDVAEDELSEHIRSRLEVERLLTDSGVPTITARAAILIGSGSTSFEILRHVSERLPVQTVPTWMRSEVQPIAVVDAVQMLAGCLDLPAEHRTFDIGGPDRMPYAELLRVFADVSGIVRPQVRVPRLPSALVGQVTGWMTGVPAVTVASLVESLHHDMVCAGDAPVAELLPEGYQPLGVRRAIERALTRPLAGTRVPDRDPMGPLPSDPAWAGGEVYLYDGQPRRRPRSLAGRLLLGPSLPPLLSSRSR
jgi:uncharacterized protein YbjT (DUF2867 family)